MIKLNNKEKILVIALGLVLIIFMLKAFVFSPMYEKISDYSDEIAQSKLAIRKFMALEHNRPEILKAQKQIEGYSSLKGSEEEKVAMIMSKVESEARKAKLQILDMSPAGSSKVKGGVVIYKVQFRAESQLKSLLDFMSGIENANILLQFEKLALSTKGEGSDILKIDSIIVGVSFS
jgi:hypothetical protein